MSETIILTEHLSHIYHMGTISKAALVDVSLQIARGSCAAIIGVTGSGKSTLIQHFNGLLFPSAGNVVVDGIEVKANGTDLRVLRQRVGLLFQHPESQLFAPTIYEDVAFGPQRLKLSRREVRMRVFHALDAVGLPHHTFARRSPFALSGGQKRRIALAGVLAMQPDILILDEPTVGLDAEARTEFYAYLEQIRQQQGVTILLVSHDMAEVALLADHLFVLHDGHLVLEGPPAVIFSQGDHLHSWGLAAPPLNELTSLLRKRGVPIPEERFTLDDVYLWLYDYEKSKRRIPDASR